ncbi:MAG: hypothetical protein PHO56_01110 [Patescibacteria group bacterium]|nr:hypothetical protein [Patescibacteria group bacterium]
MPSQFCEENFYRAVKFKMFVLILDDLEKPHRKTDPSSLAEAARSSG